MIGNLPVALVECAFSKFKQVPRYPPQMTIADYLILGSIGLSMVLSLYRGFTLEALSLVTWVAAFVVARLFSVPLAIVISEWVVFGCN